jgi:glyoxylase-like metal-dependent hydrolase (beta-lactamase superfamily II)
MTTDPVSSGTPRASCVRANNPGPYTLAGTNTWILGEPGADRVVVVDPGPDLPEHLEAVLAAVAQSGRRVGQILLTHGHPDHAEGAAALAATTGSPVLALDSRHQLGSSGLTDGQVIELDGLEIRVIATPGHTADSLSFLLSADAALLTGDTVLGYGTSVVAYPDGRLADYLSSLARLQEVVTAERVGVALPGHGPALVGNVGEVLAGYLAHRAARLEQVRTAVFAGAVTPAEVVAVVYGDVDRALWPAAELSAAAQLHYLRESAVD